MDTFMIAYEVKEYRVVEIQANSEAEARALWDKMTEEELRAAELCATQYQIIAAISRNNE